MSGSVLEVQHEECSPVRMMSIEQKKNLKSKPVRLKKEDIEGSDLEGSKYENEDIVSFNQSDSESSGSQ